MTRVRPCSALTSWAAWPRSRGIWAGHGEEGGTAVDSAHSERVWPFLQNKKHISSQGDLRASVSSHHSADRLLATTCSLAFQPGRRSQEAGEAAAWARPPWGWETGGSAVGGVHLSALGREAARGGWGSPGLGPGHLALQESRLLPCGLLPAVHPLEPPFPPLNNWQSEADRQAEQE